MPARTRARLPETAQPAPAAPMRSKRGAPKGTAPEAMPTVWTPDEPGLFDDLSPANMRALWAAMQAARAPEDRPPQPWFGPKPNLIPWKGSVMVPDYKHFSVRPDDPWPRFSVPVFVHDDGSTYCTEVRKDRERFMRSLSVILGIAQGLCTLVGKPATCPRRACTRRQHCSARKAQIDWSFPGPQMPPCVEPDEIDFVRRAVRSFLGLICVGWGLGRERGS